jgi:hypothetical protein
MPSGRTQERLIMNITYQLLVYADDINLLAENLNTVKKNTEPLRGGEEECIEGSGRKT